MKTFVAKTVDQWRAWLDRHHRSESEIWLVFHKRHTGLNPISYHDALDEALCFGWVDSLVKRLDDTQYARKFTPRKPDSHWSTINRHRYEELKAAGRLKPAGLDRAPTHRGYEHPPVSLENIPRYIRLALKNHATAWRHFESLAPSHQRRYLLWIESAKKDETKQRRLAEAIRLLAAGQSLGLK